MNANIADDIIRQFKMFREIQLLANIYNRMHRFLLIPVYIVKAILVFSCCCFVITTRFHELHFTGMMIFSNAMSLGIMIMLFCFHFPATVFKTSGVTARKGKIATRMVFLKNKLKSSRGGTHVDNANEESEKFKLMRKYWRSFPLIKIFFFHRNFIGRLTPLVLFKFSSRIAINLMLMERKH